LFAEVSTGTSGKWGGRGRDRERERAIREQQENVQNELVKD